MTQRKSEGSHRYVRSHKKGMGALPKFKVQSFEAMQMHGRMATLAQSHNLEASDKRVLNNTPCLKNLYAFLDRPLPWELPRK